MAARNEAFAENIASAAAAFQLFVAAYATAIIAIPPTSTQLLASDPLIQLIWPYGGAGGIVFLCAALSLPWIALFPPSIDRLVAAAKFAGAGALVAFAVVAILYWIGGGAFPSFVPPEESAAPGLALGLGAGALEEAAFRFAMVPLVYFLLRKRLPVLAAVGVASLVTGVGFALSHELGAGAGPFHLAYFATRVIVPGAAMSLVFFAIHPAFLVTAHCAAHLGINLFFHAR